MRDALEDDGLYDSTQRLDGVEARLNSYAHIPRRWRGTDEGFSAGLWMEDAREDIGLERRKEARRARKEREQRLREETRNLEREAQAEREMRAATKAKRRIEEARRRYEERWTSLLSRPTANAALEDTGTLNFDDIPWPIYIKGSKKLDTEEFTKDAISSFLLHKEKEKANGGENTEPVSQSFKDILRTTMLRFHPDKFEARILSRVVEKDRELVKEAANAVVQFLNDLLKEYRE
ncbi:uncharacterized protein FOMMEDRAFT_101463 [Fomitiporia mediterranea MF3/22]|uniref:uncharacterized protein n=1 Tax=Fomitiporia mediterranea (strain MF3/22) TaxID=694068 RepID=UPI00044080D8|nr:uncharacterized protein FOMMEDRAFT_101463 [Fomitiporia mediterranea MF3/22]EJD08040.1 hypothetical protein FOMMEDRAFT_101463 [Fomitiporia mediterranea MF3/22]